MSDYTYNVNFILDNMYEYNFRLGGYARDSLFIS